MLWWVDLIDLGKFETIVKQVFTKKPHFWLLIGNVVVFFSLQKNMSVGFSKRDRNSEHDSAKHPDSAAIYSYLQTISGPFGAVF